MSASEPVPIQLSPQEIKQRRIEEIRKIVAARLKPEWQQTGVPLDQTVIDQELETAARDVVDLARDGQRDKMRNPYPGELSQGDTRWYIPQPLSLDQYHHHRAETDSWGSLLHSYPDVMFNTDEKHTGWGVSINPKDNKQYPGLIRTGKALAQLFQDCGFPLTPETRQIYLPPPAPKSVSK